MSGERYKSGRHLPAVKRAAGVRLGTWLVLAALCDRAEYDSPTVTITKDQISEITGLERKAVQRGLSKLRAKGVIVPTQGFAGGKGVAVTYTLEIIGQGAETATEKPERARKCPPALVSKWHKFKGMAEALERKRRYEDGESVKQIEKND